MISPAAPIDERERLLDVEALRILDTPREERFDRLVRLLATALHVPIAYIAVVDEDRQWFKSRCGFEMTESGRDVSFCGHTILGNGPLIVEDARLDPRFRDNPHVKDTPCIRFYAGVPLRGPRGFNVGTLCVADTQPRKLGADQEELLVQVAAVVEHELNLMCVIDEQHSLIALKNKLVAARERMAQEIAEAADYVESLLPRRLNGEIRTNWHYEACSRLGGDFFGYGDLNERYFVFYLLDASGHGVGSALLACSVHDALHRRTLACQDYTNPGKVLTVLNQAYPMRWNNFKFLTIWYGVFDRQERMLRYANAGHPPPLLFLPDSDEPQLLAGETGTVIGADDDTIYVTEVVEDLAPESRIILFSDGLYEVACADDWLDYKDAVPEIARWVQNPDSRDLADIRTMISARTNDSETVDDVSILDIRFGTTRA